ncbi:MAG: hypothetical protein FWG05_06535, partial [Kiritimatiellaeota bacterium]|nr:hypothetical protein [Kiritimatiellota bacterium]
MKTPSSRGAPFWAWNAKLSPAELRRQIRTMKQMGLGGFFMHSRVGLDTEYLGADWFKCVNACVDEAKKQGMDAWLYDEDRWPSGAAGGIVTKAHPEFGASAIAYCADDSAFPEGATPLADFAVKGLDGDTIKSYRRIADPKKARLANGEKLLRFHIAKPAPNPWYNDGVYLDVLNKKAVAEFIRVTHEKYARNNGADFGGAIPGIFTDEPQYYTYHPCTPALVAEYARCHKADLLAKLPELFFIVNGEVFSETRYNYARLVTDLFVGSFFKQIGDWCGKHDLLFTGHCMAENSLPYQRLFTGDAMRCYEYMQAPGMDLLTEVQNEYRTAKQLSSVARQFGRKTRLSETYGCTGWDFSMEGHKALGDWQMALGVNLRCQHLAWYSMEAQAKRDYPASIFDQSPWWKTYSVCEDYFARVGEALADGAEKRDILLIQPIESDWGLGVSFKQDSAKLPKNPALALPNGNAVDAELVRVFSALLSANLDFDFGCEDIIARHGKLKIENSKLKILNSQFLIKRASYSAVVIPPMLTIRSTTLALLEKFADSGGAVYYVGEHPLYIDGKKSAKIGKTFAKFNYIYCAELLADEVAEKTRLISITQDGEETDATLFNLIESANKKTLTIFVCNTSNPMPTPETEGDAPMVRNRAIEYPRALLRVYSANLGAVTETDALTGETRAVAYEYKNGAYEIPCPLSRLQTRLFKIGKCGTGAHACVNKTPQAMAPVPPCTSITLSEPNVLLLDAPTATVDGKPFGAPDTFILTIDRDLRAELGARPRGGQMVQPWAAVKGKPKRKLALTLEYKFECAKIPAAPVSL